MFEFNLKKKKFVKKFLFSNTTQLVNVDQSNLTRRFLSDYKRRCYEDEETAQNQMTS